MDFGVSEVLLAGTIASAVAGAASTGLSIAASSAKAEFEAEQYRQQKEYERVAALEQEVERRRELEQIQAAQLAARGTQYYEGSMLAVRREDERIAEFDLEGIRIMSRRRLKQLELGERQANLEGRGAMLKGAFDIVGSLATAAYRGATLMPTRAPGPTSVAPGRRGV